MIETYSDGIADLITLCGDIATTRFKDAEGALLGDLVDFYTVQIYWEFQLSGGVTEAGIADLWDRICKQGPVVIRSVLDFGIEFRIRGQLGQGRWNELLGLLGDSLSLLSGQVTTKVSAKEYSERSLPSAKIVELLNANSWIVPLILLKLGKPLVTTATTKRSRGNPE